MRTRSEKGLLATVGNLVAKNLFLTMILTVILGVGLIVISFNDRDVSILHLVAFEAGKTLLVSTTIAIIAKWYLTRKEVDFIGTHRKMQDEEYKQELNFALNQLQEKVSEQTSKIASYVSSLDTMQRCDMFRVYESRIEASHDIKSDILDCTNSKLRIIGVTLNDFLRPSPSGLHEAWQVIESYVRGDQLTRPLDIKILLIDPSCEGAYHRAKADEMWSVRAGSLENSALESIKTLQRLVALAQGKNFIKFDVRLYRTAPMLFLVHTDFVSYVQQYHFGGENNLNRNAPIICFHGRKSNDIQVCSMQERMEAHFDYLWENSSVGPDDYLKNHAQGCDIAIRRANVANMYYDPFLWKKRVFHLMESANERLYLKGITLHSFFSDGELFDSFSKVAGRPGLKVRVMLIDPECEQAKMRSFREYLLKHPNANWHDFCNKKIYKRETLYVHTKESMENMLNLLEELSASQKSCDIGVKKFISAPEGFMLLTDQSVLVEQYHYGKIRVPKQNDDTIQSKILWGEVPALEYSKPNLQTTSEVPFRNLHLLFEDHFLFVYNNFAEEIVKHD